MFAAIFIFCFLIPAAILVSYNSPKHINLFYAIPTLIFGNVIIQLCLLIPNNSHRTLTTQNIDILTTGSIAQSFQASKNISETPATSVQNDYSEKDYSNTDSDICYDCGMLPYEPDFSNGPPLHDFIWPARGKVIRAFLSPIESGDGGINISLPIGSKIRAISDGTVAYSGDLKSYGKLVIIRHNNGFVSAYAHTSELRVKKGDLVKRGDIIARSGKSGNVHSPQLHFALIAGSTPVDPQKYILQN